MCGYVDPNGQKYIIDNSFFLKNGDFGLSTSMWQKKDFADNNIKYITTTQNTNHICGPAALNNIENISKIYDKLTTSPNKKYDCSELSAAGLEPLTLCLEECAKNNKINIKLEKNQSSGKNHQIKEEQSKNKDPQKQYNIFLN